MRGARFGILTLVPAMLNLSVAAGADTISVAICTGDGQVHTVQVPVGGSDKDGNSGGKGLCCAKGCHSGNNRKRLARKD
ncbi:MAG: hypothetical protein ACKOPE_00485 [Novosphingobium sp.]